MKKNSMIFLGKLLNREGFIKIDQFLILVDFINSKVYAQKNGNTSDILSVKKVVQIKT